MKKPSPDSLLVKSPPWIVALVAIGLVGALVYKELGPPADPVDALQEAFDDFVEAFLDRDGDELWEMTRSSHRRLLEEEFERLRELARDAPEFAESPVGWDELQEMEITDLLGSNNALFDEYEEMIREIEVESISIEGERGIVTCSWREARPSMQFVREDDEWRIVALFPNQMKFMTLERLLHVPIPLRGRESLGEVHAVVEIGRPGLDAPSSAQLTEVVRDMIADLGTDTPCVVLDVSADLSIQELIHAVDALMIAGVREPWFADSTGTDVPDGVRVNGTSIGRLGESGPPPLSPDHPALTRNIGIR